MDLLSAEARRNPYPVYEALRATGPVAEMPGAFLLLDHADVKAAMKAPDTFSSSAAPRGGKPLEQLIFFDPPRHTKLRALVLRAFTPRMVAELQPRIQAITASLLDAVGDRDVFDVAAEVAAMLPVHVLAELLGLPESDRPLFRHWADAIVGLSNTVFGGEAAAAAFRAYRAARVEYEAYASAVADERRARPRADLLSQLVLAEVDGERLTLEELHGFFELLLAAGTETSASLVGNAVLTFLERPDIFARLRASPELVPAAIEEVIRHRSPVQAVFRETTRAVTMGGKALPERSLVLLMIGAANRDARVFEDPDRFDVDRDPTAHVGFGHGIHFCIGAALGRLEAKVAVHEMVRRFARIAPASDEPWTPRRAFHVLGPSSLPVRVFR